MQGPLTVLLALLMGLFIYTLATAMPPAQLEHSMTSPTVGALTAQLAAKSATPHLTSALLAQMTLALHLPLSTTNSQISISAILLVVAYISGTIPLICACPAKLVVSLAHSTLPTVAHAGMCQESITIFLAQLVLTYVLMGSSETILLTTVMHATLPVQSVMASP